MALTNYDAPTKMIGTGSKEHRCHFSGHKRVAPAGGNRHNISVIIAECNCGKIKAKFPEKVSYRDALWVSRVNRRIENQNKICEKN